MSKFRLPRYFMVLGAWLSMGAGAIYSSPQITELMAGNASIVADQDGDYADWIEVYNPDSVPADLSGWYLTNKAGNLTKWACPSVVLAPGQYIVIFCSGKNYSDPAAPLATNFTLSSSGGFVGLVQPDGKSVATSFTYPAQNTNISYGISQPSDPAVKPVVGFLAQPTPGAPNGENNQILLGDRVSIQTPPGVFQVSTNVVLSGGSAGTHIRYVVADPSGDGTAVAAPDATSNLYTGPIAINSTELIRAAIFSEDDSQHGLPSSALYILLDTSSANRLDTFSSRLPLVVFDNHGAGALVRFAAYEPAWVGAYSLKSSGAATLTQTPDFFVPDSIKLHGFSSATFPKQSVDSDITDDLGNSLAETFFGLDNNKSWVSIAPWFFDRAYIRNAFVYSLSRSLGYWAPTSHFAEAFVHTAGGPLDANSYGGIVEISDRLKVGASRINIFSLSTTDTTAPNVTGGYILKIDHPATDAYAFTTSAGAAVQVDTPKLSVIVPAQALYISKYVQQMEDALVSDNANNYSTRNYLGFIDRPSWVDYHLLNVLVENVDAFQYSEYFTKDVNGPIKAGPVWDYDRSMGSGDGRDNTPTHWTPFQEPDVWSVGWWNYLAHDPDFMQAWVDRWQTLRQTTLATSNLSALAQSLADQIGPEASARDAARWADNQSLGYKDWAGEVSHLQDWLAARTAWIDSQFVPAPSSSVDNGVMGLSPPAGTQLIYTVDGSDPRSSGGGLAANAIVAQGPVYLKSSGTFTARSYNPSLVNIFPGSPWSSSVTRVGAANVFSGQLSAISSRTQVGTGDNILIGGFVISGSSGVAQQVLIRGVGPTLSQYNVAGCLAQPVLTVFDSAGAAIATNTGWGNNNNASVIAATAAAVGDFALPAGSSDCAVLISLLPGAYTVQVSGVGQSTGNGLVEVYQVGSGGSNMVDVATRALVNSASGPLIVGFVINGGSGRVLLRGDGPGLVQYGVSNVLTKPVLQVYDSAGKLVASNTGWGTNANSTDIAAAAASVGAFALAPGSADSALLLTLPAGAYTLQVSSGSGGSAGDALAECYLVP